MNYFTLVGIKRTEPSNIQRMIKVFSSFTDPNEKKFTSEIIQMLDAAPMASVNDPPLVKSCDQKAHFAADQKNSLMEATGWLLFFQL